MIFMDNKDNEQKDSIIEKGKQNIINAAGKKAASTFGGPLGGKAYDALSKTELGQKAINKVSEQLSNPKNIPGMGLPGMPGGLPKPSGLQNNNDGLKEKQEQENKNKSSGESSTSNSDDSESNNNEDGNIIQKWKSMPTYAKSLIMILAGFLVTALLTAMIIIFIQILTSVSSEILFEKMVGNGSQTDDFYEDDSNFFINEENSEEQKAERAYYEKLQDVYEEFQDKYGVSIDTTLITATLFYGRTVEDYSNEEEIGNIEKENNGDASTNDNLFYESDETEDNVEFYKLAKRHIKTLAKYMLIQNTTFNACVPDNEVDYLITPATSKQIADNWTTISTWKFKDHSSWNSLNAFNYTKYNEKTYTNANGQEKTITWCNYDDADTQLRAGYEEDRKIYHSKKDAYHSCINSHRNACINSCALMDEDCRKRCDKTVYDIDCSTEKSQMDEAYGYYYNNWLSQGLYDDGGNFTCKTTEKWGHLETWDDTSRFMNHKFDLKLKDVAHLPNFLEDYESYMLEEIDCSAEPSIKYIYSTDTSEEGVYYYKLLTKTSAGFFSSKKSFIERYYPELIDNTSEETRYKSAKNIVDEIFLLYDTVVDRDTRYCITPSDNGGAALSGSGTAPINSTRAEFIESIANDVIVDMQNSGILASVTIAQAILESASGTSSLTTGYNNYYGITAPSSCDPPRLNTTTPTVVKSGTGENRCKGNAFWNGDVVWHCNPQGEDCQWYRIYDSFSNSTHDHSRLLSSSLYNCQGIGNPFDQLTCIKSGNYATDPNYVSKLIKLIDSHNLTQYDIGEWSGEILGEYGSSALGTICYDTAFEKEIANGEGTINGILNGQRTQLYGTPEYNTFWLSNNNLFYASNPKLAKECTWYANGRGLEILTSNGMDLATAKKYMFPMHGNATEWYSQNEYFSSSTAVNNPKVGAIIVWSGGKKGYGHVAVIEDVQYDSSGNAVSVSVSEGGQGVNGFQYKETRTIDYIRKHGNYNFVGYVYLLG